MANSEGIYRKVNFYLLAFGEFRRSKLAQFRRRGVGGRIGDQRVWQSLARPGPTFEIPPRTLIPKQEVALFLESSRNQTNRYLVLAFVSISCLPSPSKVPTRRRLLVVSGARPV